MSPNCIRFLFRIGKYWITRGIPSKAEEYLLKNFQKMVAVHIKLLSFFESLSILALANIRSGRAFEAIVAGQSSKIFPRAKTPHFNFFSKFIFAIPMRN